MAADKALNLQMQVRRNTEELGDFLKDLDRWEDDIKSKDEDLKISKTSGSTRLPPVRNQAKKKKVKKNKDVSKDQKMKSRISSYDYRSWDKLNVDELINDLEEKEEMETLTSSDDGDGDEMLDDDDEQAEEERRLQRALLEKDKGNDFFKIGRYKEAINCYTTAMQLDPNNAIFPANRAMALLKVERHGAAELDCDLALSLDYSYTKAYLRRGKARSHLNKLHESLSDFKEALRLEPGNKQAQQEILNLKQKLGIEEKPPQKSDKPAKKPLKRIVIEEIGSDSEDVEVLPAIHKTSGILIKDQAAGSEKAGVNTSADNSGVSKAETTSLALTEDHREPPFQSLSSGQFPNNENNHTDSTKDYPPKLKPKRVFNVPKTSVQFQSDWKVLKGGPPEQLFDYLRKIKPEMYPKLLQQSIESDVLTGMLQVLHQFYIPAGMPVYNELRWITQVKRFSMAVMFLSPKDKSVLEGLFKHIRQDSNSPSEPEITALSKTYGL